PCCASRPKARKFQDWKCMSSKSDKKKSLVPRLRFPEFREAGAWEVKRLGEVCIICNGSSNAQDHVDDGAYPLFDRSEEIKRSSRYLFDAEAVIIPGEGMRFIPKYYCGKFDLHQRAYALSDFREVGKFIYYQLGALKGVLASKAVMSTVLSLRMPILETFKLVIPSSGEQQKIAHCLSSLDEVIGLQAKKVQALKQHKKGLMQQLFPAEGETTPRLRFPEFREAGAWEVQTIDQLVSKIAQGGTPKTSIPKYWNGDIPWITPAEMGEDAAHHYAETTLRTISREGFENSSTELLPVNSVIISSRAPIGYVTINKVEMATNQGCKGFVPKKNTYHEFFYFSLIVAKQRLNDLGAGAGFKEISTSTLKAFQISIPKHLEQQKIAHCLSSLDEVIGLESHKLDALKNLKKGLMQQLFPQDVP
ncbi:restriction endonuclease subunit S, partial [Thiolapillus sp.]|uniref:restriction endonuclease subunit S n=1 Tax=Thiolapillus sp. TaxID=2017437 RepID=UPI003AF96483